jgi:hypothetical protein
MALDKVSGEQRDQKFKYDRQADKEQRKVRVTDRQTMKSRRGTFGVTRITDFT